MLSERNQSQNTTASLHDSIYMKYPGQAIP